jgi:hypothetical protein
MERTARLIVIFAAMLLAFFGVLVPTAGSAVTANVAGEADSANVAGEWNLTLETPNGTFTPTVIFKQDGATLTGTYKGRAGETPLKGTINGNDIKFSVTVSPQGQDLVIAYSGTVDGDTMKGNVKFGDMGEAPWSGKKKAADAPAPTPAPK